MPYISNSLYVGTKVNLQIDWTDWLSTGASLTSSSWSADTGVTVDSSGTLSGASTWTPVTAVTGGKTYRVRNTVIADNAETDTREIIVPVALPSILPEPVQSDAMLILLARQVPPSATNVQLPPIYEQSIFDGVAQLSHDLGVGVVGTLSIVSGQSTYDLPDDYLGEFHLIPLPQIGHTFVSDAGLVPTAAPWTKELVSVVGRQLIFSPTPGYTATRSFTYTKSIPFSGGTFVGLTSRQAQIALLYSQYLVLQASASSQSGQAWRYTIGDETIDKSGLSKNVSGQADGILQQYLREVSRLRPAGRTAQYGIWELPEWAAS